MNTNSWYWDGKWGCVTWRPNIYRHNYTDGSHRWVIHPAIYWDVY